MNTPQHTGRAGRTLRVISTEADYAAASAYLQTTSAGLFSASDSGGSSASLATAYGSGEALRAASMSADGGDDDSADSGDSDQGEGRGALAFALLAFMLCGVTLAAWALYLTTRGF